jgi:hypothetical protein
MTEKGQRIIGLRTENIKRVTVVEIHPDPSEPVVRIAGENEQGKSSLLDSISYAFGGKKLIPTNPIRVGADRAEIKVETDDFYVVRNFKRTEDGYNSTLRVTGKDGLRASNGQEVLDKMLGKLTFDPLEFALADPKRKYEIIRSLVKLPIDLGKWQLEDDSLREERLEAGRDLKRAEGAYQTAPYHRDAPLEGIDVSAKSRELGEAEKVKSKLHDLERVKEVYVEAQGKIESELAKMEVDIVRMEKELRATRELAKRLRDIEIPQKKKFISETEKQIGAFVIPDIPSIIAEIDRADELNKQVAENKRKGELRSEAEQVQRKHEELGILIKKHDQEKLTAFAQAKFPLPDLSFGEGTVLYKGIDLEEASDAAKTKISIAIAMALNPDLRVILIRRGALLSSRSQKVIADLAFEKGYQVWMEVVEAGEAPAFIMEEGALVGEGNENAV